MSELKVTSIDRLERLEVGDEVALRNIYGVRLSVVTTVTRTRIVLTNKQIYNRSTGQLTKNNRYCEQIVPVSAPIRKQSHLQECLNVAAIMFRL
jgi:hypothetical protein